MAAGIRPLLERLRAAWDASPALIVLTEGPAHTVVYQNPSSIRLFGPRSLGQPMTEAFPELSPDGRKAIKTALAEGVAVVEGVPQPGVLGRHGSEVLLTYVFAPMRGDDGQPEGVLLTAFDVTGEVRTQRAAQQSTLLADLADRTNQALDPVAAVTALVDGLVPSIADLAAVFVLPSWSSNVTSSPSPASSVIALSTTDAIRSQAGTPPERVPRGRPTPWDEPLARGLPLLIDVGDDDLAEQTDPKLLDWLHSAGAHNLALLPLAVAGRLAGALVLLSAGGREPYVPEDLSFLELVAARAGTAVTHVRDIARQRLVALELQHALLPPDPGDLAGLDIAARYRAGTAGVDIGGDWWDVQQLRAGVVGLGLGDVCGHGVHAAAVMGQLRIGMRAAALAGLGPAPILSLLDEQLVSLTGKNAAYRSQLATAVYALLDLDTDRLTVANAGHPPLLMRYPGGELSWVHATPGPPLGVHMPSYVELTVPFPPGSLLVGCTDGLVESRQTDIHTGMDLLRSKVASLQPEAGAELVADELLAYLTDVVAGRDDVALVVLRRRAG